MAARRDGNRALALELCLILARIGFARADLGLSAKALGEADGLTNAADPTETRLRVSIGNIRLARLLGDPTRLAEAAERARNVLDFDSVTRVSPSVLRELAGEIASEGVENAAMKGVFQTALRRLGIEHKPDWLTDGLANAISLRTSGNTSSSRAMESLLSGLVGAPELPDAVRDHDAWQDWLRKIPGASLGQLLARAFDAGNELNDRRVHELVIRYLRDASERARTLDKSNLM